MQISRKQSSNESEWEQGFSESVKMHPISEIERLAEDAKTVIRSVYGDDTIIGFSGGKDSIVLRSLCEDALESPEFIFCELLNEYPLFNKWVDEHRPERFAKVFSEEMSLEYLNENPEYLFPDDKAHKSKYVQMWNAPVFDYAYRNGKKKLLTGRRIADGNFCGKKDEKGIRSSHNGKYDLDCINPIAEWSHTQLLAYIQYKGLELPCIYSFPNGFVFGTHPWTERDRVNGSYKETFEEIMGIDSSIILSASKVLYLAKEFIGGTLNI